MSKLFRLMEIVKKNSAVIKNNKYFQRIGKKRILLWNSFLYTRSPKGEFRYYFKRFQKYIHPPKQPICVNIYYFYTESFIILQGIYHSGTKKAEYER